MLRVLSVFMFLFVFVFSIIYAAILSKPVCVGRVLQKCTFFRPDALFVSSIKLLCSQIGCFSHNKHHFLTNYILKYCILLMHGMLSSFVVHYLVRIMLDGCHTCCYFCSICGFNV